MNAVAIESFGGIDQLQIKNFPVPDPRPDEVLIQIDTAGVGAWDAPEREGYFARMRNEETNFPYILGREASGTVLKVGEQVRHLQKGDPVYVNGSPNPEANLYAEYATAIADDVRHIPTDMSMEEAGAMPIDAVTALTGLDDVLKLAPDDKLLIFGASGGLGHLALQFAKRIGADVFAVASGDDGVGLAKELGADYAVDGHNKDLPERIEKLAPEKMDAALLTAGGEAAEASLDALREGGKVAYPNGIDPEPGERSGLHIEAYNMKGSPERYDRIKELVEKGTFSVHVSHVYNLADVKNAHKKLDEHYLGKIALKAV